MTDLIINLHLSIRINSSTSREATEGSIKAAFQQGIDTKAELVRNLLTRMEAGTARGVFTWAVADASRMAKTPSLPPVELPLVPTPELEPLECDP